MLAERFDHWDYLSWLKACLGSMWFGVTPRTDTRRTRVHKTSVCAQNMITISWSTVNIIGKYVYDHLMSTRIFTLVMVYNIHMFSKNLRKSFRPGFGFANHLVLIACSIYQEKWASWGRKFNHLRPIYVSYKHLFWPNIHCNYIDSSTQNRSQSNTSLPK